MITVNSNSSQERKIPAFIIVAGKIQNFSEKTNTTMYPYDYSPEYFCFLPDFSTTVFEFPD